MAEASEAARLDTASREADMQIQQTQMSAEDRMQQAQLGEAASLQMAEAAEASKLQELEAGAAMDIQSATMQGQLQSAQLTMQKESTLMDSYSQASAQLDQQNKLVMIKYGAVYLVWLALLVVHKTQ